MARKKDSIDLEELSRRIREARERKDWTLEQLSHELWVRKMPTSVNKLWRLETNPPKRLDIELLLFLEKVLGVELIHPENKTQVLISDVVELLEAFCASKDKLPPKPANQGLDEIYEKAARLWESGK